MNQTKDRSSEYKSKEQALDHFSLHRYIPLFIYMSLNKFLSPEIYMNADEASEI